MAHSQLASPKPAYVAVHPSYGVYLGLGNVQMGAGGGSWSLHTDESTDFAVTFSCPDEAVSHLEADWGITRDNFDLIRVAPSRASGYATADDLREAGIPDVVLGSLVPEPPGTVMAYGR